MMASPAPTPPQAEEHDRAAERSVSPVFNQRPRAGKRRRVVHGADGTRRRGARTLGPPSQSPSSERQSHTLPNTVQPAAKLVKEALPSVPTSSTAAAAAAAEPLPRPTAVAKTLPVHVVPSFFVLCDHGVLADELLSFSDAVPKAAVATAAAPAAVPSSGDLPASTGSFVASGYSAWCVSQARDPTAYPPPSPRPLPLSSRRPPLCVFGKSLYLPHLAQDLPHTMAMLRKRLLHAGNRPEWAPDCVRCMRMFASFAYRCLPDMKQPQRDAFVDTMVSEWTTLLRQVQPLKGLSKHDVQGAGKLPFLLSLDVVATGVELCLWCHRNASGQATKATVLSLFRTLASQAATGLVNITCLNPDLAKHHQTVAGELLSLLLVFGEAIVGLSWEDTLASLFGNACTAKLKAASPGQLDVVCERLWSVASLFSVTLRDGRGGASSNVSAIVSVPLQVRPFGRLGKTSLSNDGISTLLTRLASFLGCSGADVKLLGAVWDWLRRAGVEQPKAVPRSAGLTLTPGLFALCKKMFCTFGERCPLSLVGHLLSRMAINFPTRPRAIHSQQPTDKSISVRLCGTLPSAVGVGTMLLATLDGALHHTSDPDADEELGPVVERVVELLLARVDVPASDDHVLGAVLEQGLTCAAMLSRADVDIPKNLSESVAEWLGLAADRLAQATAQAQVKAMPQTFVAAAGASVDSSDGTALQSASAQRDSRTRSEQLEQLLCLTVDTLGEIWARPKQPLQHGEDRLLGQGGTYGRQGSKPDGLLRLLALPHSCSQTISHALAAITILLQASAVPVDDDSGSHGVLLDTAVIADSQDDGFDDALFAGVDLDAIVDGDGDGGTGTGTGVDTAPYDVCGQARALEQRKRLSLVVRNVLLPALQAIVHARSATAIAERTSPKIFGQATLGLADACVLLLESDHNKHLQLLSLFPFGHRDERKQHRACEVQFFQRLAGTERGRKQLQRLLSKGQADASARLCNVFLLALVDLDPLVTDAGLQEIAPWTRVAITGKQDSKPVSGSSGDDGPGDAGHSNAHKSLTRQAMAEQLLHCCATATALDVSWFGRIISGLDVVMARGFKDHRAGAEYTALCFEVAGSLVAHCAERIYQKNAPCLLASLVTLLLEKHFAPGPFLTALPALLCGLGRLDFLYDAYLRRVVTHNVFARFEKVACSGTAPGSVGVGTQSSPTETTNFWTTQLAAGLVASPPLRTLVLGVLVPQYLRMMDRSFFPGLLGHVCLLLKRLFQHSDAFLDSLGQVAALLLESIRALDGVEHSQATLMLLVVDAQEQLLAAAQQARLPAWAQLFSVCACHAALPVWAGAARSSLAEGIAHDFVDELMLAYEGAADTDADVTELHVQLPQDPALARMAAVSEFQRRVGLSEAAAPLDGAATTAASTLPLIETPASLGAHVLSTLLAARMVAAAEPHSTSSAKVSRAIRCAWQLGLGCRRGSVQHRHFSSFAALLDPHLAATLCTP
eukprot:m.115199 g.115199  ORF g.115199 m.115199 type:complete len:1472 (-) comp16331_c0_seq1:194-4609(-)